MPFNIFPKVYSNNEIQFKAIKAFLIKKKREKMKISVIRNMWTHSLNVQTTDFTLPFRVN